MSIDDCAPHGTAKKSHSLQYISYELSNPDCTEVFSVCKQGAYSKVSIVKYLIYLHVKALLQDSY